MLTSPKPTSLTRLVEHEDVGRRRRLTCVLYDHCLDQAVAARWTSWTCERCPLFAAAEELASPPLALA